MEYQRDSKSFAVKLFLGNGHHEQIKFATEMEMEAFAAELEQQKNNDLAGEPVTLVTLLLEDNTNIRIDPRSVYFFKSFKMTKPRGRSGFDGSEA